jgi:triosephosphate isomerase
LVKRTPFVAGNWKMNTDRASAVKLAAEVASACADLAGAVDVAVCPPFVYLDAVGAALRGAASAVMLGAQDAYFEPSGAFTGEVSTSMLRDVGARCVIVGHSERRHVIGETDALTARKVRAVLDAGLSCILCVGETMEERKAGRLDEVNLRQTRTAVEGLSAEQIARLTIAYEPVWAIGTGLTATPADAQEAHAKIRAALALMHGETGRAVRILYGGSMKPDNAKELMAQPDVDGGLIGGASLKAADFMAIVRAAM